jgi:hypothetical protein
LVCEVHASRHLVETPGPCSPVHVCVGVHTCQECGGVCVCSHSRFIQLQPRCGQHWLKSRTCAVVQHLYQAQCSDNPLQGQVEGDLCTPEVEISLSKGVGDISSQGGCARGEPQPYTGGSPLPCSCLPHLSPLPGPAARSACNNCHQGAALPHEALLTLCVVHAFILALPSTVWLPYRPPG